MPELTRMVMTFDLPSYQSQMIFRIWLVALVRVHPSDADGEFAIDCSCNFVGNLLPDALGIEVLQLDGPSLQDRRVFEALPKQVSLYLPL